METNIFNLYVKKNNLNKLKADYYFFEKKS